MQVAIVAQRTDKIVALYPITLKGLNYTPSDEEYFSAAWECALEDGIVEPDSQSNYSFRLIRPS